MPLKIKPRLDPWQLEVFCAVAEAQSFSGAARRLFLSQPTVTAHIAKLEKQLGTRLFDRTTRKVSLTPAGKLLYRHAKRLLKEHEQSFQELSEFLEGATGTLHFGASTTPGQYILPPLLARFQNRFPKIRMQMTIADSQSILDGVSEGRLEFGIIGFRPKDRWLKVIPLWEDEIVLLVHPKHPWAKKKRVFTCDLLDQPLVWREEGSGTRATVEQFLARHKVPLHHLTIIAEVGSTEAVKHFITSGRGVGIAPLRAVACETDRHHLVIVRFHEGQILRRFYAFFPTGQSLSPAAQKFLKFLQNSGETV